MLLCRIVVLSGRGIAIFGRVLWLDAVIRSLSLDLFDIGRIRHTFPDRVSGSVFDLLLESVMQPCVALSDQLCPQKRQTTCKRGAQSHGSSVVIGSL